MTSIHTRLTLWLLGSVVILLGTFWMITSRAPVVFTEEYVATRLEHDAETLINGIRFKESGYLLLEPDYVAPIYFRLNSGHYYLIKSRNNELSSPSLGGAAFDVPLEKLEDKSLFHLTGPNGQKLLVWVSHYEKDSQHISLAIAEELTSLEQHLSRFRFRFGLITLALFTLLVVTQRLIVQFSLKPLDRIKQACRLLETGDIKQLPDNVPAEVKPLSNEINRLITVMQQRLMRSRNALGNLAHALKTPLALLTQLVEDKSNGFEQDHRQQAASSVAMIHSIIDRELKRARLAGPSSAGRVFHLNSEIHDIVGLLKKVYAEKNLQFSINLEHDGIRFGDREDMLELIGNLLDNASKWANRKIKFTASIDGQLKISVEDDGPGIPAAFKNSLKERGKRLDESKQGHGLGLSIIQDIVKQYDGRIEFSVSPGLGGLKVDIELPTATLCRDKQYLS